MPEFASIKPMLNPERKVSKEELIRTIRYFIAAEYEAVQLYMQLADSTDDKLVKKVLIDIAEEEIVHAGEFLRLLKEIYPEEFEFYKQGKEEVEEMMEKK